MSNGKLPFTCERCGKNQFPQFVMSRSSKLIAECSGCQYQDPSVTPATINVGLAALTPAAGKQPGWDGRQAVVVQGNTTTEPARPMASVTPAATPIPQPVVQPVVPITYAPAPQPAQAPGDVISWIQQRVLFLGTEDARLEGELAATKSKIASVRAERMRLMKMLKAGQRTEQVEEPATQELEFARSN